MVNWYDTKSYSFGELKDLDMKGRRVSGYLSAFGNKDWDGDIIVKGAFTKTLKERKGEIRFLNQHDWKQPHGFFDVLEEDEKGLYFVSNPLIDTSYSTDALKLYEAGIMKEHSIGFHVIKDEYNTKEDTRYINEIKLFEGSNVTLGANSNTPFTGFKSMTKPEVDKELKLFLKAYRNGTFTDETFGLMEIAIRQLMKQSADLAVEDYKSLKEPFNDTHEGADVEEKEVEILNEYLKKWQKI